MSTEVTADKPGGGGVGATSTTCGSAGEDVWGSKWGSTLYLRSQLLGVVAHERGAVCYSVALASFVFLVVNLLIAPYLLTFEQLDLPAPAALSLLYLGDAVFWCQLLLNCGPLAWHPLGTSPSRRRLRLIFDTLTLLPLDPFLALEDGGAAPLRTLALLRVNRLLRLAHLPGLLAKGESSLWLRSLYCDL